MLENIDNSLIRLYRYCREQGWSGYDPFDGLNVPSLQRFRFLKDHKLFRLLILQAMKKSPFNLRPILGLPRERNSKGLGLFLHGACNLYEKTRQVEYLESIKEFAEWLNNHASSGYHGKCWGYNFDWQSRAFFLPQGTPTVVNTSFIGRAFIKAYEVLGQGEYLAIARSSCDFLLQDLNKLYVGRSIGFSYSPLDYYFVNNATALASSLLGLVYSKTKEDHLGDTAKKAAHHVALRQQHNGSWHYGEDEIGRSVGVDNFHTGFILESLKIYSDSTGDKEYLENLQKGLEYYQKNFFLENGAPKYFPKKTYPMDIHSGAQAILTLLRLKDLGSDMGLCRKLITWMLTTMQDRSGYFYYQKTRYYLNKIPYMRWSQAWAFLALSSYLN